MKLAFHLWCSEPEKSDYILNFPKRTLPFPFLGAACETKSKERCSTEGSFTCLHSLVSGWKYPSEVLLYSFNLPVFLYFEVKNQVNLWPRISKSPGRKPFPFCCLINEKLPFAYRTQKTSVEKTWGFINSELQFFWIILFRRRHLFQVFEALPFFWTWRIEYWPKIIRGKMLAALSWCKDLTCSWGLPGKWRWLSASPARHLI